VRLSSFATTALLLAAAGGLAIWAMRSTAGSSFPAVVLDGSRPLPQGDFLIGTFPEPAHLDPFTNLDPVVATWVLRLTHDTLCTLDASDASVRPALAERVEQDGEDGLRIELRRDARFSDGTPVTAADVAFSHACARTPGLSGNALVRAAGMLQTLAADGPYVLHGRGLQAHWAARDVFTTGLLVVSRAAIERALAAQAQAKGGGVPALGSAALATWLAELPDGGPGSGPYMLAPSPEGGGAWQRGQHLDLVQNPYAWHRRAGPRDFNLAGFRHLFVTDRAAQLALLRAGRLDWIANDVRALLAGDAALRASLRVVVYDPFALGPVFVAFNCRSGALADARVRQALARLFDRETIARDFLHGDAFPAAAWFEPAAPECPSDLEPLPFDVAGAAALLRAAGFGGDGQPRLRVEIVGAAQEPLHRRILELAQPAFAAAGVELVPQLVEAGVLRDRLLRRDFTALLAVKYHPDPWIDPWPHFHGSQTGPSGQNWMGFADPETDALLDAARTAHDASERIEALQSFCRRIAELQPVALLVHPRTAILLHARFRDVEAGAAGMSPRRFWVPPAEQLHR